MSERNHTRVSVLSSAYSLLLREQILASILQDALDRRPGYLCVSNVHTTMTGVFDPSYQQITNESTYSVPDGMPLVWAMNALDASEHHKGLKQDRVRGPSLMKELCDRGRALHVKHYLYGGSEKTLEALQKHLHEKYPGILIVGAESPPFKPLSEVSEEEMRAAAGRINQSGAQLVWIGLGAPKQERWMFAQRNSVKPFMLGIGAAFDLLPGIVPEAPQILQNLGLEWLYRLCKEPKRLWRRYVFNNPAFVVLFALQLLRYRLFRKNYLCESKRQ